MRVSQLVLTRISRILGFLLCWYGCLLQIVLPSHAQEVSKPKVIHLAPLEPLPDRRIPEQGLTVDIVIQTDGSAELDDPHIQKAWIPAVQQALKRSHFEPATVEGEPIASRVRVRFSISGSEEKPSPERVPAADSELPPSTVENEAEHTKEELSYGATAHVERSRPDLRRLETEELRDLPGAFGDPFRAIDTLPGVTPYTNALPYVYVRGAPPAGTLFIYDDISLPTLFHLGLGPAVIHPAMIGPIVFYSGVGPARYGRRTGGLFTSAQRQLEIEPEETSGELELRLIDLMGMVHTPVGDGNITAAGRYGYPGPILSLVSPEIDLAYWDYQFRLNQPLENGIRTELIWFGSYDSLSVVEDNDGVLLTFHRLELRLLREFDNYQYGTALLLGYEESNSDAGSYEDSEAGLIWSGRIGPRIWLDWQDAQNTRLRLGADMVGIIGKIETEEEPTRMPAVGIPTKDTSRVPAYVNARDVLNYNQFNNPLYTWVAARNAMGVYSEVGFRPTQSLDIELGLRGDVWLTGHRSELGVDPRVLITHYPLTILDVHLAFGLVHQPAVFLLPLPGMADVALDRGLQEAVQSEFGVGFELPDIVRIEVQAFLHYYTNLLFPELTIEKLTACGERSYYFYQEVAEINVCQTGQGFPRATALAYGTELFLHRAVNESVSGWLSYTLSWAEAESDQGFTFTPVFDRRHVGNLVIQYRPAPGWSIGLRLHARSGKMYTILTDDLYRLERRLPGFFRTDLQAGYGWRTGWGTMRVSAEWFNLTLAREARSISCGMDITDRNRLAPSETCQVQYGPALFFPNVGLRATF